MLAIAVEALYTTLRKRGTTRQLAGAIIVCVFSALLLLLAFAWLNLRFAPLQAAIPPVEVTLLLLYVALFGWVLPLGVATAYCLFAAPRLSSASLPLPRQKRITRADPAAPALPPPLRRPGEPIPFVFDADTPWGWLEHRSGRFQGQRLALKRRVITIGRGEENEIWLDDDLASRAHAELVWDQGRVYIVDCDSLNGVLLNGRRIRGSAIIRPGELLEIGTHRFLFDVARSPADRVAVDDDPLLRHAPRSSFSGVTTGGVALPVTPPVTHNVPGNPNTEFPPLPSFAASHAQEPEPPDAHTFVICSGERIGSSFVLQTQKPLLTIGRSIESDIVIDDPSISRRHAQVLRQPNGVYVQDLASQSGTSVNNELLRAPRLLQPGDIIRVGNVLIRYMLLPESSSALLPGVRLNSGPLPLRLPLREVDS